jgi:hypothetical protein
MSQIHAKRAAPEPVQPVSDNGITYSAPASKRGVVEAHDDMSGQLVWETEVYSTAYDPELEKDVQDVFITDLRIDNGRLLVSNEKKQEYALDLKTGDAFPKEHTRNGLWLSFLAFLSSLF